MYLRIVLLLLPLVWEWQVAAADCDKTCYDYEGTLYETCQNKIGTRDETDVRVEPREHDVTIVKCDEDIVFSGSRTWYELPDGVTDIVITELSISATARLLIGRLICSFEYECYTITLTSEAKPSIVIRLKASIFKIQAFGLEFGFASLTFRAVCERKCAKMKMPENDRQMKRIVNGDVTMPHQYVFMARLETYYSDEDQDYNTFSVSNILSSYTEKFACGGSIIHERWILTAAHCVLLTDKIDDTNFYLMGVKVFLGDHYTNVTETEERTRWVKPQDVHLHDYNIPTPRNNDIALLKVESIEPNKDFRFPICLAPSYMDTLTFLDDCDVTSAGWGVFDATKPDVGSVCLREGFFTVENNDDCAVKYEEVPQMETITANMICTTDDKTNTCYGDSGGPVFCKDRYQTFLQVGVNSFNEPDDVTLWKHDFPQVGARVTRYIGWINGKIAPDTLP